MVVQIGCAVPRPLAQVSDGEEGGRGKSDNRWVMLITTAIGGIAGEALGPWRVMSGEDVAASCYQVSGYRGCASCE